MERIVRAIVDEMFLRSEVGIGSRSQLKLKHCEIREDISFRQAGANVWKSGDRCWRKMNRSGKNGGKKVDLEIGNFV